MNERPGTHAAGPSGLCLPWRLLRGTALVCLGLLVALPGLAQRYPIRHYTVDDGLPSSRVQAISQGPDGRIWFATRSGIAWYDGQVWRVYNLADGLVWADQARLGWDEQGRLWSVGSRAPFHLFHLENERWHSHPIPTMVPEGAMLTSFALLPGSPGQTVALGTSRGLLLGRHDRWRLLDTAAGLPASEVVGLAWLGERLLVATSAGLAWLEDERLVPAEGGGLPAGLALAGMALEPGAAEGGGVWLFGPGWVGRWDDGKFRLLAQGLATDGWEASLRWSAVADGLGGLVFGNPQALFHFDVRTGLETLSRPNGLLEDGALSLLLDREGIVWIGGRLGVSKLVTRQLATFTREHGLAEDDVTAVLEQRDGSLLLGHENGALSLLGPSGVHPRDLGLPPGVEAGRLWDIAVDSQGTVWLASESAGLMRLPASGPAVRVGAEQLPQAVTSLRADAAGALWLGTGAGLFERTNDGFRLVADQPPNLRIRRVLSDDEGRLLLATTTGLYRRDEDGWRHWPCTVVPGCESVFAAYSLGHQEVWAGTAAGLFRVAGESLVPTAVPLTIERPVYFIVRDLQGSLWFGTDNGVLRWNGTHLRSWGVRDGVGGRETNRAAGLVDRRGNVWVGTERGVTRFEPELARPRPAPLVSITALELSGRPVSPDQPISVDPDEDDFTVRFQAISFLDEERTQFSSWLEGLEESWRAAAPRASREERFVNLPPGRYRFHLRASNADGVWSDDVATGEAHILKPLWRRGWFVSAVMAAFGALSLLLYSQTVQSRYARRLEREVAQRTRELAAEKERLAVTLGSVADGVITADAGGVVRFLNAAAHEITGWREGEAVAKPLAEVLPIELGGALAPWSAPSLEGAPVAAGGRFEMVDRSGQRRRVELASAPFTAGPGSPAGVVLAFRDVTERETKERELAQGQTLEALGLLAGGIAHDFNNLLTVILGGVSLLKQPGAGSPELLRALESAALRAKGLTQQLLTFSRGGDPVRVVANVAGLAEESVSLVLLGSKVGCEFEAPRDLWPASIDVGQISQVFNNLLINAVQAMPLGGTVRCVLANEERPPRPLPPGPYVTVAVIDSGQGISPEHLPRIFDPYFSTKGQGRGLGLATAYSIAKRHDGLLMVSSELGEGTTFKLYLPALPGQAVVGAAAQAKTLHHQGRVLIMDDDETVRSVLSAMVGRLGFEVALAAEGGEAIEFYCQARAAGKNFDLVIMDLTVPGGMGGQEAMRRLSQLDPEVKAIVVSGYSTDPVLAEYRRHGFVGCISKPFLAEELAKVVEAALHPPTAH